MVCEEQVLQTVCLVRWVSENCLVDVVLASKNDNYSFGADRAFLFTLPRTEISLAVRLPFGILSKHNRSLLTSFVHFLLPNPSPTVLCGNANQSHSWLR